MENLYKNTILEVFNMEEDALEQEYLFSESEDWDSLIHINLIAELEEKFDVLFEPEDILNFNSYRAGIEILQKYGVKFDGE